MAEKQQSGNEIDLINTKFNSDTLKRMKTHGLDRSVLGGRNSFRLEDAIIAFKPKFEAMKTSQISSSKQQTSLEKIFDNPLKGSGLTVITSYPTDTRSKMLAANIFAAAIEEYDGMSARSKIGKASPVWHRLTGSYQDPYRDGKKDKPSMLIMSNIVETSSHVKLEKLRDLLEIYSDIPRIVVMGSTMDPVTFIGTKLYCSVDNAIYLTGQNVVQKTLLDL